jgi:hypothetical protein
MRQAGLSRRSLLRKAGIGLTGLAARAALSAGETAPSDRPNILLCLSDDQSYPHAGAYGEPVIETPAFDRVAARACCSRGPTAPLRRARRRAARF